MWAKPEILVWLWLVLPAAVLCYLGYRRRSNRLGLFFGGKEGKKRSGVEERLGSSIVKSILLCLVIVFVVAALAGPRLGFEWTQVKRQGVDIVVAVDVSKSMLAEDIKPNRMERAKREIRDLLALLEGDRLGIVAFAGVAYSQCPLTLDYSAARMFLDYVDTDLIPVPGTNLGDAIKVAEKSLRDSSPEASEGQAIILITDGEDQEGNAMAAAEAARKSGIKIFTIGVGSEEGAPIPEAGGGYKKDRGGSVVISKPNERILQQVALTTGGVYVRSVTGEMDLEKIYLEGIKKSVEDREYEAQRHKLWHPRYQWFVAIAILLLMIEFFVRDIRIVMVFLAISLAAVPEARAGGLKDAHDAFENGEYDKAADGFLEAEIDEPGVVAHSYNRAVSQFQAKDYEGAAEGFQKATKSEDKALQQKSFYNHANSLVAGGKLKESLPSYQKAIELNSEDKEAKENLAWVKKKLEEMEKQEQEQQDNKDKDDQEKDQDKEKKQNDQQNDEDKENREQQEQQDQQEQQEQEDKKKQEQQKPQDSEEEKQEQGAAEQEQEQEQKEMEEAEAEKLLRTVEDNIKKYMYRPQGTSKPPKSGKDW